MCRLRIDQRDSRISSNCESITTRSVGIIISPIIINKRRKIYRSVGIACFRCCRSRSSFCDNNVCYIIARLILISICDCLCCTVVSLCGLYQKVVKKSISSCTCIRTAHAYIKFCYSPCIFRHIYLKFAIFLCCSSASSSHSNLLCFIVESQLKMDFVVPRSGRTIFI